MIRLESAHLHEGSRPIFSNMNLSVEKGEKVLIKGPSGSGKTSFFHVLEGFKQLSRGEVFFEGTAITSQNIHDIRNRIFYLSQDIDFKNETVQPMLKRVLSARKIGFSEDNLSNWLQFLELEPSCLEKETRSLSGGERQRVGLLLGFLLDCPVWLLDEPTSALEDQLKTKIADAVVKNQHTVLVISHDAVWETHPEVRQHRWNS